MASASFNKADLEELYLTTTRGPIVLSIFLCLGGIVTCLLHRFKIDYKSVLAQPKLKHKPVGSPQQLLWLGLIGLSAVLSVIYLGRSFQRAPNVSMGAFYLALGLVVLLVPARTGCRANLAFLGEMICLIIRPGTDIHFAEVFLADAFTSLSKVLSDAGITVLILLASWTGHRGVPRPLKVLLAAFLSWVPYWLRLRQCKTQFKYEVEFRRRRLHLLNIGKYCSALPVVTLSALEALEPPYSASRRLFGRLVAVAAIVNTLYCFVWDVSMDWGLVKRGGGFGGGMAANGGGGRPPGTEAHSNGGAGASNGCSDSSGRGGNGACGGGAGGSGGGDGGKKKRWCRLLASTPRRAIAILRRETHASMSLRKTMLLPRRFYGCAISADLLLRCMWIMKYAVRSLAFTDAVLILETVEVCRRSMWSLFRIEWEVIQTQGQRGGGVRNGAGGCVGGGAYGGDDSRRLLLQDDRMERSDCLNLMTV